MKTGSSLSIPAKMLPRRASVSFRAPRARCTMYWSVHQYQRPMIGAQRSIPGHGKLPLKYHAIRFGSSTGAQAPSIPSGMIGFHRLKRSGSRASRSPPQPPSADSPNQVKRPEPTTSTSVCSASV